MAHITDVVCYLNIGIDTTTSVVPQDWRLIDWRTGEEYEV